METTHSGLAFEATRSARRPSPLVPLQNQNEQAIQRGQKDLPTSVVENHFCELVRVAETRLANTHASPVLSLVTVQLTAAAYVTQVVTTVDPLLPRKLFFFRSLGVHPRQRSTLRTHSSISISSQHPHMQPKSDCLKCSVRHSPGFSMIPSISNIMQRARVSLSVLAVSATMSGRSPGANRACIR